MTVQNTHETLLAINQAAAVLADDALRRVLVVDDEATIRLALSRFLRTRGFEVAVAETADVALAALSSEPFALMLCDLRMPGMSGLDMVPKALAINPDLGVIMLTAVNDAASATDALASGAFDYLTKPVELPDLQAAVDRALSKRTRTMERRAVDRLIREEVAIRTRQLEQEKAALRDLTVSVAETLINAMEAKDLYLRGHSHRVAELAVAIGGELGLPISELEILRVAGRLHDVGKIGIREEVLNKPGPLTPEEFDHIKDHVRIGIEILSPLSHLGETIAFIQDHHEHWDGNGYPRGLTGDSIVLGGRILTAADAFDALTSNRAYREPMSAPQTLEFLRSQSGLLLDPRIFTALETVVRSGSVPGMPQIDAKSPVL